MTTISRLGHKPHYVYTMWDAENRTPLYVGCTHNLTKRMAAHAQHNAWWHRRVTFVAAVEFPDRESALDAERERIVKLRPEGNIIYNSHYHGTVAQQTEAEMEQRWNADMTRAAHGSARDRAIWLRDHPDAPVRDQKWMAVRVLADYAKAERETRETA